MKGQIVTLGAALLLSLSAAAQEASIPPSSTPPPYCNPCLYYGGDFQPESPNQGAFTNGNTIYIPDSTVYAEFAIPTGQVWEIIGLLTNNLSNDDGVLDPKQAVWSISSGLSAGNPGMVIASGTAAAWVKSTGRGIDGSFEYTVRVGVSPLRLGAGEYWLSVQPQCTNAGDEACTTAEFGVTNTNGTNAYGPAQAPNAGFETSSYFGVYYLPLCQFHGPQGTCRLMSAGVLGHVLKQ